MGEKENKRRKMWCLGVVWMLSLLLITGCSLKKTEKQESEATTGQKTEQTKERVDIAESQDINNIGMIEDLSVYDNDNPDSIVYFYVTVQKGDKGSQTDHTFKEVNQVVRFLNDSHVANDIYAKAIVQVGDKNGPQPGMLGYGVKKSNAKIRIRGNSSTVKEQKSYKLALDDEAGLWRGQSNIALNKHAFDTTRIKNKIYFDMLREVEHVPSIRTQFVRLFIKDETAGKTKFEDYGLYTQAEVPTRKYLKNHGLDGSGYLYKAISFNFEHVDALKNFDDPEFNQKEFDQILSCKGREDNQKLIELVDMINDKSVDINEIIGDYIDRDNYLTWLGYNILMANVDTTVQNFYLYSPLNSQKWFFVPWDGDNMLHVKEDMMEGENLNYGTWEHGISNYWGVMLHQRFLKNESNRKELEAKVDELYKTINRESVDALVKQYNQTVEPYVTAMPDFYYLGHTKEERNELLAGLGGEVEESYKQFKNSLHELMPFFMFTPEQNGKDITFTWDEAYDFGDANISYDLVVGDTPDFKKPAIRKKGLVGLEYKTTREQLPAGTWYWKVTAHTEDGRSSQAMNKIQVNESYYPGVEMMEVRP